MSGFVLKYGAIALFACMFCPGIFAQSKGIDTNYIKPFDNRNVVEFSPGIFTSKFIFSTGRDRSKDFSLVANSNAYAGVYFQYKWLAFNVSTAIPGTQLDKNIRLRYSSVSFHFGTNQLLFHPFYKSFNGLLIPEKPGTRRFLPFKDIQIMSAGTDIYYFVNARKFSYRASNYFFRRQLKSQGSLVAALTPYWQSIKWRTPSRELIEDSSTYDLLISQPQWAGVVAKFGYTHNFVFNQGRWSISPMVLAGVGGLYEINYKLSSFRNLSDVQINMNAGYNGDRYYVYLTTWWHALKTNLFVKELKERNYNLFITYGYRFGTLKKRVLGIL